MWQSDEFEEMEVYYLDKDRWEAAKATAEQPH